MDDVAAKTAKKTTRKTDDAKLLYEKTALDRCYGKIGISAVAAAARYQGGAKNPAYAPVATKWDGSTGEAA
jgi:hypothetical protein